MPCLANRKCAHAKESFDIIWPRFSGATFVDVDAAADDADDVDVQDESEAQISLQAIEPGIQTKAIGSSS